MNNLCKIKTCIDGYEPNSTKDNCVLKSYDVIYDTTGGTIISKGSYTVDTLPFDLPSTANRTGYTFAGWYDNSGLSGTAIINIPVGSATDITVYAKWTPNKYYITLRTNCGTKPDKNTTVFHGTYFDSITDTSKLPGCPGYTFNGYWIKSPNGDTTKKFIDATGATSAEKWEPTICNDNPYTCADIDTANPTGTIYAHWAECGAENYCTGDAYNSTTPCPTRDQNAIDKEWIWGPETTNSTLMECNMVRDAKNLSYCSGGTEIVHPLDDGTAWNYNNTSKINLKATDKGFVGPDKQSCLPCPSETITTGTSAESITDCYIPSATTFHDSNDNKVAFSVLIGGITNDPSESPQGVCFFNDAFASVCQEDSPGIYNCSNTPPGCRLVQDDEYECYINGLKQKCELIDIGKYSCAVQP
ncbi:MAG: InlB B-repeat-containing protein [Rickettsiales bacterium]|jgi:uncharacterized repeat protein (TIGR02543 family)|nr:InlB B-repeat-containing protein [Rickettsiales bacterium]